MYKNQKSNVDISFVLYVSIVFFMCCGNARAEFLAGKNMNYPRYGHTATKLLDGTVLITGGYSGGSAYYDTAEIYNPQDGSFTLVGNKMTSPRCLHTATLLLDGRVLICGGADKAGIVSMLDTAEIYDPDSKTFQPVDQRMHSVRENHRAVRLKDGKVFISGGTCGYADVTGSCDLFDPCDNSFTEVGPLSYSRTLHVSVLLDNGNVLIAGGTTPATAREIAEVYEPGIGLRHTGAMNFPRYAGQADLLPDGRVLLTGGINSSSPDPWNIVEIYDPETELFTVTKNLLEWRIVHKSVSLPDGRVLITGGCQDSHGHATASTEIYDPITQTFTSGDSMTTPRGDHCINLLDNGCILVTGGYTVISGQVNAHASTEINCAFTQPEPAVIYVDDDAPAGGDGSSWAAAYKYLQDALASANYGDEIRVAEGIYRPDEDTNYSEGTGDRSATFQLINGVILKGGFAGFGEPDPDVRDTNLYETILSGDLADNDGPDWQNYGENSYHVVTADETDNSTVLDGFTVTGGNATQNDITPNDAAGAGLIARDGSPTLTNCTIRKNRCRDNSSFGGGIYIGPDYAYTGFEGNPIITDCNFSGNRAALGGGLSINATNPVVTNCIFSGNHGNSYAGGIHSYGSLTVTDSVFTGNSIEASGGGGGAIASRPYGGGTIAVTNCVISGNSSSGGYGGGISISGDSPDISTVATITNCTFSSNQAGVSGNGIWNRQSNTTVTNCIFWDGGDEILVESGSVTVNYSDVQGGWSGGVGNIDIAPLFVDPANDDYHLLPDSNCIDAGDNNAVPPEIITDLDGMPRIMNGVVDMGAYELQNKPPVADAGGPHIAQATSWSGATIGLDGTGSNDPEGGVLMYEWDLDLSVDSDGDGDPNNDVDANEPTAVVLFPIGQTEISLIVTDEHGLQSGPDVTTVTVSVIDVGIDIKPGSFPNAVNLGSHGVIPVAFMTEAGFDASTINPATVTLRGVGFNDGLVKLRGKKDAPVPMSALEDIDGDGDLDLVVHLDTERLVGYELQANCEIGALTYDGYVVSGSDTIVIVPE